MKPRITLVHAAFFTTLALGATPARAVDTAPATLTPIKHVILMIGENRTFDNMFGRYVPPKGQTVRNLLSEGILKADGTPGPHFGWAAQWQAKEDGSYSLHPKKTVAYTVQPWTT